MTNQNRAKIRSICYLIVGLFIMPFASIVYSYGEEPPVSGSIQVNQLGYLASSLKIATVSSPLGLPFRLIDDESEKPMLSGMLQLVEADDQASGSNLWIADFSVIEATGRYRIQVPGIGRSFPFRIGHDLYSPVSVQTLKSFYYHRCGISLPKRYSGVWERDECDSADAFIYSVTPEGRTVKSATGGWHDGSDNGKYTVTGVFSAAVLLQLHESLPNAYRDGSLRIPESGNGVPDIVDEIRWELEWLLKMQDSKGGFHHKLTSLTSSVPDDPSKNKEKRYIFPISTAATAGSCALFAKASRIYASYDVDFATRCLDAARSAWDYLEKHPPDGGFQNPKDVQTKAYNDGDDSDERFWAAIELFLTTHDSRYEENALEIAEKRIPLLAASGYWGNVMPLAAASILHATKGAISSDIRDEIVSDLSSLADTIARKIRSDGYRLSIREGEFTWGSNAAILQNMIILYLANRVQPKTAYQLGAMDQLHYLFGRNPLSMCYVTGFGTRSPQHPYHPFSILNQDKKPVPGLLVGGPNQFLSDRLLRRTFPKDSAPATMYLDSHQSFASNETAITWNAILGFSVSVLSGN